MELLNYCIEKRKIIIYGAGFFGKIVRCFLIENGIDISCFVVTEEPKEREVLEAKVLEMEKLSDITSADTGIVICGNHKICNEMQAYAINIGISDYYVVTESEIQSIDEKTNYNRHFQDNDKRILLYHRVGVADCDIWNMFTSPENFKNHLQYLKKEYRIVKYEDIDINNNRDELAITIDDGYVDSYTTIMPIVCECEVPVTIFVSTGNIGTDNEFWWDTIEGTIMDNPLCPTEIYWAGELLNLNSKEERINACWKIWNKVFRVNDCQRTQMIDELISLTKYEKKNRPEYRTINERELVELDRCPWITIGAHTVSHTRLTSLSDKEKNKEILKSKEKLESILNHDIKSMSFPFGCRNDYDIVTIDAVRNAGYDRAASVELNFEGNTERYNMPRLSICDSSRNSNMRVLKRALSLNRNS